MVETIDAVRKAADQTRQLLESAAQSAIAERAAKTRRRHEEYTRRRRSLRMRDTRLGYALSGALASLRLGAQPEVQELLGLRGPIALFQQRDIFSDSSFVLGKDGVYASCNDYGILWGNNDSIIGRGELDALTSFCLFFRYGIEDELILTRELSHIFSMKKLIFGYEDIEDENERMEARSNFTDATPDEILSQLFVDFADSDTLQKYFLSAIDRA